MFMKKKTGLRDAFFLFFSYKAREALTEKQQMDATGGSSE